MVAYLTIGIIVSIAEMIMAYIDAKKLGLTGHDIWPELSQLNRVGMVCLWIINVIILAIVWPWQVYYWVRRIVSAVKV